LRQDENENDENLTKLQYQKWRRRVVVTMSGPRWWSRYWEHRRVRLIKMTLSIL